MMISFASLFRVYDKYRKGIEGIGISARIPAIQIVTIVFLHNVIFFKSEVWAGARKKTASHVVLPDLKRHHPLALSGIYAFLTGAPLHSLFADSRGHDLATSDTKLDEMQNLLHEFFSWHSDVPNQFCTFKNPAVLNFPPEKSGKLRELTMFGKGEDEKENRQKNKIWQDLIFACKKPRLTGLVFRVFLDYIGQRSRNPKDSFFGFQDRKRRSGCRECERFREKVFTRLDTGYPNSLRRETPTRADAQEALDMLRGLVLAGHFNPLNDSTLQRSETVTASSSGDAGEGSAIGKQVKSEPE